MNWSLVQRFEGAEVIKAAEESAEDTGDMLRQQFPEVSMQILAS